MSLVTSCNSVSSTREVPPSLLCFPVLTLSVLGSVTPDILLQRPGSPIQHSSEVRFLEDTYLLGYLEH